MTLSAIHADLNALRDQMAATVTDLEGQVQAKIDEHQSIMNSVRTVDAVALVLSDIESAIGARRAEIDRKASIASHLTAHDDIRMVRGTDGDGLPIISSERRAPGGLKVFDQASALDLLAIIKPAVWTDIESWAALVTADAGTPGASDISTLTAAANTAMDELVSLVDQLKKARADLASLPTL